jgi:hypothetical protein
MKFLITESKLMETMDKFFEENFSEIKLPLVKRKSVGHGNRGYGSGLDDYTYSNVYYYGQEDMANPLFIKWDDNYFRSDQKWDVDYKLELIYNFFGEESFEKFIKWKFGLDIKERGSKITNWSF